MTQVDKKLNELDEKVTKIMLAYLDWHLKARAKKELGLPTGSNNYHEHMINLFATHTQQVREELIGKIPKKKAVQIDIPDTLHFNAGWNAAIDDILTALGDEG